MPEGRSELTPVEFRESPQYREIRGVWEAMQYVVRTAKERRKPIDEQVVKNIHKRALGYFHPEVSGKYRDYEVAIHRAIFLPVHWSQVREKMWAFGNQLQEKTANLDQSLSSIDRVVLTGAWAHYQLARIHPFADGNGRTSRLLTDLVFKRAGLYYITDWGAKDDTYIDVLRQTDSANDLRYFEAFLAGKLAARHAEILEATSKSAIARSTKGSALINDIRNRQVELERISRSVILQKHEIAI